VALKVPITMFDKPEQARAIFEPYVKHLQSAVEAAINSQLMPQLLGGDAKFKFRNINVDDAFVKAKTDMIYLSEGVLAPGEVRLERGLNPEGVAEVQRMLMFLEVETKIKQKSPQGQKTAALVISRLQIQRGIEKNEHRVRL
jgi:hypothetical protein